MLIREYSNAGKSEPLQLVSEHHCLDCTVHLEVVAPLLSFPLSLNTFKRSFQKPGYFSGRWFYPIVGNSRFLNARSSENLAENRWFLTKGDCELDYITDS